MFKLIKNSKILGLAFMLCIASLLVDCSSGGGSSGGGGTGPGVATCRNGIGAVGACVSCDTGFQLSGGLCNPIPGAPSLVPMALVQQVLVLLAIQALF